MVVATTKLRQLREEVRASPFVACRAFRADKYGSTSGVLAVCGSFLPHETFNRLCLL